MHNCKSNAMLRSWIVLGIVFTAVLSASGRPAWGQKPRPKKPAASLADRSGKTSKAVVRRTGGAAVGINLAFVIDHSTELVFADLFKQSRPWVSQQQGKPWGSGPALALDPDGWIKGLEPGQYASTIMCSEGGQPQGRYLCLYDGQGTLEFSGSATVVDGAPGRLLVNVSGDKQIILNLLATDPQNPVRNIRLVLPGLENRFEKDPFTPYFLQRTSRFDVIRFMDWARTNNSTLSEWENRTKPTHATQAASSGVALEYMIELCNRTGASPWFCMPHLASDSFVRQFADQVRSQLDRKSAVYVEHSNELWNPQFKQTTYAREKGGQLGLSNNSFQAQLLYHAKRSVEIFKIWREVFGNDKRLVCVLGSQTANPWVTEQVINFPEADQYANAVAVAPYFGTQLGLARKTDHAKLSLDEIFAKCQAEIQENAEKVQRTVQLAGQKNLKVVAYEGGQHLCGVEGAENNTALTTLFHSANRDPRMKSLYVTSMNAWRASGGDLFCLYNSVARPSKWGSWGLLESEGQDPKTSPKYQAITSFLK